MDKTVKIHPKALVETKKVGTHSRIWAFVHILTGAKIGKNANICDHCFIENEVTIGDDVTIKSGVYLWDGITVENKVMIGPAAAFTNDKYPRSKNTSYEKLEIHLKEGSSIGANATIVAGITIGRYALIGAGSVVTKNVPDYALVYGNPGSVKGYVCMCGQKLKFSKNLSTCSACNKKYKQIKKIVSKI